jgi:hypothetical protein
VFIDLFSMCATGAFFGGIRPLLVAHKISST